MISLSEFLSSIGRAGTTAAQAAAVHNQDIFRSHFKKGKDGVLVPRMVAFEIDGRQVEVPAVSLVPNKRLELERIKVEFESEVDLTPEGTIRGGKLVSRGNPELELSLKNGLFKASTRIQVVATFVAADEPEAAEKLRDRINTVLGRLLDG